MKYTRRWALVLAAAALASCGGGDPYVGLWEGTVDGKPASAIMLGDGTYYLKYGVPTTLPSPPFGIPYSPGITPAGLIRGTGDFKGATFASADGLDFHMQYPLVAPTGATVSGKLGGHQTVTGNVNGKPLSLRYVKPFDPTGSLAELAGSYPGQVSFSLGLRTTTFAVTADGKLSTVLNGCTITGQAVPRSDDDAFDLTLTFGGYPCVFPGAVFQGAVIYSHDLKQLDASVVNTTYGQAITFVANKAQ